MSTDFAGMMSAAIQAAKTGTPVGEVYGKASSPDSSGAPGSVAKTEVKDETLPSGEEQATPADESAQESQGNDEKVDVKAGVKPDIDTIVVDGKKIEIDWNDRASLRKSLERVEGAKRAWSERDAARKQLAEIQRKFDSHDNDLKSINTAFQKGGIAGVINLLTQDDAGYQKWEDKIYNERKAYDNADEPTRKSLDAQRELDKLKAELKFERETIAKEKADAEAAAAKLAETENRSMIDSSFTKHQFSGKLGDEKVEKFYNDALYDSVRRELSSMPEDTEVDSAMLDKLFQEHAQRFLSVIDRKANEAVTKTVAKKKDDAALKLNAAAKRDVQAPSSEKETFYKNATSGTVSGLTAGLIQALKAARK
jgi:hypothetical protein